MCILINPDASPKVRIKNTETTEIAMKPESIRRTVLLAGRFCMAVSSIFLSLYMSSNTAAGAHRNRELQENQIDRILKNYRQIEMDLPDVAKRVRTTGELRLSTEDGEFYIILTPHDVRGPNYRAEEVVGNGFRRPVVPEAIRTYRGTVLGMRGSEARFSVRNDTLEGIILTPDEWYLVEPMRNYDPSAGRNEIVIYRASDIMPESYGTCAASLAERIDRAHEYMIPQVMEAVGSIPGIAEGTISVAEVATEADYEYVTAFGSSASANNTILDIMNQVDGIYRTQVSVSLQVAFQHAWDTAGDPYTSTAPSTMLGEFRSYWTANFSSQPFDLAHMWTGKDMDGSTIGIAYVGVVCNARSYSFGVSQRFSPSPGKYILTAHEMGHNFGASHPDQATPPQTECSNTIMNSSVGTGTNFCSYSQTEINTHTAGNPSCLATVAHSCDVNDDGQLNAIDMQSLVNVILGIVSCPGNCDTNQDGSTNVLDVQLLLNIIIGTASCP
jgi:hypothetical protein